VFVLVPHQNVRPTSQIPLPASVGLLPLFLPFELINEPLTLHASQFEIFHPSFVLRAGRGKMPISHGLSGTSSFSFLLSPSGPPLPIGPIPRGRTVKPKAVAADGFFLPAFLSSRLNESLSPPPSHPPPLVQCLLNTSISYLRCCVRALPPSAWTFFLLLPLGLFCEAFSRNRRPLPGYSPF